MIASTTASATESSSAPDGSWLGRKSMIASTVTRSIAVDWAGGDGGGVKGGGDGGGGSDGGGGGGGGDGGGGGGGGGESSGGGDPAVFVNVKHMSAPPKMRREQSPAAAEKRMHRELQPETKTH